ncbi:hypothetical protein EDC65_4505 [Stella humosa]|uniref:Alpha/beta hydrolase n=1 Tax=Stella humosa TaxID=94 RepID=A0A3N1L067_9PROT|nr:alpha/beta hydrolase [Stella humosa]ROP83856.1 hypothetical protein EDC65_4505 [Stella humosa]
MKHMLRAGLLLLALAGPAAAQTETVVEVESRGQQVRALLLMPAGAPVGSVILLAGGHGKLDIGSDGQIGWGRGNQLVRTRAAYARAGFATLVPDIALDLKTAGGVVQGYRSAAPHGRDLGALVQRMRQVKAPVVVVATSRGAPSAGAMLRHASAGAVPDALVMTAAMLVPTGDNQPNFQNAIGGDPTRASLPLLVVGHRKDACRYTLPATIDQFRAWHGGKVDVILLDGPDGSGDPCEAQSAHGFIGLDGAVVAAVTGWIGRLPSR